jgi:hypothetical protein
MKPNPPNVYSLPNKVKSRPKRGYYGHASKTYRSQQH